METRNTLPADTGAATSTVAPGPLGLSRRLLVLELLCALALALLLLVCICYLVKGTYNPFIYFNF